MSLILAVPIGAIGAEPTPTPTPKKTARSLSDVAGDIKLNKGATSKDGGIVISNQNISSYAGKGRITEVTKNAPQAQGRVLSEGSAAGGAADGQSAETAANQERKQYWQSTYQHQLDLVASIQKQIEFLDNEIPGLWRDFYSWDDPFYRDGVIKPQLDEAMANRQKLEVDLQEAHARLEEIQADARRDGAEPGWFRGFDMPPTPRPTAGVMPP
jgi:hypothetical protein